MREREGEEGGKALNGERTEREMVMERKVKRKAENANGYRGGNRGKEGMGELEKGDGWEGRVSEGKEKGRNKEKGK